VGWWDTFFHRYIAMKGKWCCPFYHVITLPLSGPLFQIRQWCRICNSSLSEMNFFDWDPEPVAGRLTCAAAQASTFATCPVRNQMMELPPVHYPWCQSGTVLKAWPSRKENYSLGKYCTIAWAYNTVEAVETSGKTVKNTLRVSA
jgi:hypothetical protein